MKKMNLQQMEKIYGGSLDNLLGGFNCAQLLEVLNVAKANASFNFTTLAIYFRIAQYYNSKCS